MKLTEDFFSSKKWEYPIVILLFLAVALVYTWPLVLHIQDGLPGDNGIWEPTGELGGDGDALHQVWVMTWDARTIFSDPSNLFQGNILYPSRDVLAYSEHLVTLGVLAAPVYYSTHNPVLTYNVLLFLSYVLSAFGAYLLLKELTGSRWGGLAAGLFFAFCPFRLARTDHLWLVFSPFLPFMLLYLYRYLDGGRRKHLVLFGLFFLVQSFSSWHYLVFCSISAGLLLIWTAMFSRRRQEWMRLAGAAAAMLAAIAILLPFALPYLRVHARLPGFERSINDILPFSAKPGDFLRVLPQSVIYGGAPGPFRLADALRGAVLYPGLVALALALAGLFIRRREEDDTLAFDRTSFRRGALYFALLAAVGLVLSFGPRIGGVSNPFYTIPYNLGILKFSRTPMRFFILVVLGLAGLAGYGTAKISARASRWRGDIRRGRLAGAAMVLLLLLEMATFNLAIYPAPVWGEVPDVYGWLDEQGEVKVMELPAPALGEGALIYQGQGMGFFPADVVEYMAREGMTMYLSTYHWKKVVNGRSSYIPFFYRRIMTEMQAFPSLRSTDLLAGLGVNYVLWDWELVQGEERQLYEERLSSAPGLTREGEFGEQSVYRVMPLETAGVEDLALEAVSPAAAPAYEALNLGIICRNTSGKPFVMAEEDPQPFQVRFSDGSGLVYEEKGEYRTPFFLEWGEETSLPLAVSSTPPVGDYEMEISLEGGVLPDRDFTLPISLRDPEEVVGSGALAGALAPPDDGQRISIPAPDGLFPLVLEVSNTGENLWRARWEQDAAAECPYGLVYLGMGWQRDGQVVWESYVGLLPCDVSSGQSMEAPILIRPPDEPGHYQLLVVPADNQLGPLGDFVVLEVEVGSGAPRAVSLHHP